MFYEWHMLLKATLENKAILLILKLFRFIYE